MEDTLNTSKDHG